MDILTYINRMNQIYGNGPAPAPRYNTQQYLQGGRVGYQGGQLVDHGPGRQGTMIFILIILNPLITILRGKIYLVKDLVKTRKSNGRVKN